MTASPCIPPEDLARILELPADDARRGHVATCPRCRALADAYGSFMEPGAAADAPHVAAADRRLSAFLAREIGAPPPPRRAAGGSWLARLFAPAMRPAWAVAALVIVLGGVALWPRLAGQGPPDALRGERGPGRTFAVRGARLDGTGLRVSWEPLAGADDYEVRVYSSELAEVARLHANGDTVLTVPPSGIPFRAVPGQGVLVRVYARAHGAPLATSAPRPLSVR